MDKKKAKAYKKTCELQNRLKDKRENCKITTK